MYMLWPGNPREVDDAKVIRLAQDAFFDRADYGAAGVAMMPRTKAIRGATTMATLFLYRLIVPSL